ncbi:uncharacterized protein LOC124157751 isoform X2 [Ischnura elegans]|uniref:uncharacterized protein LOC124157751 isoform X2 n=1 Tax=Ischnura elegans TaxID=197161 RepID=UPI001ED87587|nr:uncharacterized protein LOC124157751 isoform X2 [Ischnura elegans]XP_046388708.1 uncharacterized protein LOC124157751 isoform X2 [Ischnura elegans]
MPVGFEVSAMKASFSLSSLDRSGGLLADSPEHARLRTEKPYNSLTKKPRRAWESEFDNWRHSLGSRDNEDSFLEPILPRIYTFLMDNTLIDTCKEAVGELCMDHKWQLLEEVAREGKASSSEVETLCLEAVEKEIRCLRHWIRDMEKRLRPMDFKAGFAPMELEDKAKEIQCLAVEVKAQGKVVAALILHCECLVAASAAENQEQQQQQSQEEEQQGAEGGGEEARGQAKAVAGVEEEEAAARPSPVGGAKGSAADSLKLARWLEGRWHHLYLRALEWQCYIEELISGGGQLSAKRRGQFNGDVPSPGRGAGEQSPASSDGEEADGRRGAAGSRGDGGGLSDGCLEVRRRSPGSRRGRVCHGGGPLVKKPRLGEGQEVPAKGEAEEGGGPKGTEEGPSVMEATSSEALNYSIADSSPSFDSSSSTLQNGTNMRESAFLDRGERANCAYFVVRRIDTDSEAEMKENGVKSAEEDGQGDKEDGANVVAMETVEMASAIPNGDAEETEGEEEDEEWVYSHMSHRDVKSRKSLLYDNNVEAEKESPRVSSQRVFESLPLNPSVADVSSKGKYARIRQWLKKGGPAGEESAESQEEQASKRYPIDSCDASGEYTSSGESSEAESQSSGDLDGSVATCRKSSSATAATLMEPKASPLVIQDLGISSLSLSPTDGDITPVADGRAFPGSTGSITLSPSGKMVLRVKRRKSKTSSGNHQRSPKSEQKRRPWSICVSGHGHLVSMTSPGIHPLPVTPHSTSPTPNSPNRPNIHSTVRSTSEQAIHCLAYSSSSCSTGVEDAGSNTGRVGMGSGELTPMRGSMDGDGIGSGAGSASTSSSRKKRIRTRRRTLGHKSESGNSDSLLGEMGAALMHRRGSRTSSKGLSPGSKGSSGQSTGSDFSSSNMVADESKDEVDGHDEGIGHCKEGWRLPIRMAEVPLPPDDEECEEEEKLGSLQTEETSSYSEQAWDNYQVCLSEGGEYTSDDDKTTKEQLKNLMEFGDDYRQHFDSQSDGGSSLARQPPTPCSTLDSFPGDGQRSLPHSHSPTPPSPGSSSRTGSGRRKRQAVSGLVGSSRPRPPFGEMPQSSMLPPNFILGNQGPASLSPMVNLVDGMCGINPMTALDSDSDLEDVNHFLQESLAQVMYTENVMEKALNGGLSPMTSPGKYPPPADYAEMAATCRENIKCLRAFLETVGGNTGGTMLPPRDFWAIKDLVNRWEMLESRVEECHQARLLRQEIAAMRDAMVAPTVGRIRNGRVEDLQSRKELERRIQEVKAEIAAIFALKGEILDVNVSVNRFLTGTAQPVQCPSVTTTGSQGQDGVQTPDSGRHADYAFLKDEVAEMYRDWDDSLGRLNNELAALQRVSRTWAELDEGLSSLGSDLSSDRSTLNTLSTAVAAARVSTPEGEELPPDEELLTKSTQTPALLAASVRELARVLSEEKASNKVSGPRGDKEEEEEEDLHHGFTDGSDNNGDVHMSFGLPADPLGSLSDSGISDSGSEGRGMCERGRRLAALRKLARTLAATLGPNSPPLVALKQRLDDFQKELRSLQRTCRELVFCTAMLCSANQARSGNPEEVNGASCKNSFSTSTEVKANFTVEDGMNGVACYQLDKEALERVSMMLPEGSISEGDMSKLKKLRRGSDSDCDIFGKKKGRGGKGRRHWLWRAMCLAMPFQLALVLLLYAAYFLEPHCCSAINNLSFSLTPQLHYVRGPPPI